MVVAALREQQHQLVVVGGQLLADAAQLQGEEGVGEDPGLGFGDDDRDGVVPPGHEAAGGLVGHVPELVDGLADPLDERLPDPVPAVDHPGHGGPRDTGPCGHGLQGGTRGGLGHVGAPRRRLRIRIAVGKSEVRALSDRSWITESARAPQADRSTVRRTPSRRAARYAGRLSARSCPWSPTGA